MRFSFLLATGVSSESRYHFFGRLALGLAATFVMAVLDWTPSESARCASDVKLGLHLSLTGISFTAWPWEWFHAYHLPMPLIGIFAPRDLSHSSRGVPIAYDSLNSQVWPFLVRAAS